MKPVFIAFILIVLVSEILANITPTTQKPRPANLGHKHFSVGGYSRRARNAILVYGKPNRRLPHSRKGRDVFESIVDDSELKAASSGNHGVERDVSGTPLLQQNEMHDSVIGLITSRKQRDVKNNGKPQKRPSGKPQGGVAGKPQHPSTSTGGWGSVGGLSRKVRDVFENIVDDSELNAASRGIHVGGTPLRQQNEIHDSVIGLIASRKQRDVIINKQNMVRKKRDNSKRASLKKLSTKFHPKKDQSKNKLNTDITARSLGPIRARRA